MTLVIAEHGDDRAIATTVEVIAAAQTLALPISLVVPGPPGLGIAEAFARLDVGGILCLEDALLADYSSDGYVTALAALITETSPRLVLLAHTYQARDFAPRLAARLGRPLVTDCTAIRSDVAGFTFTRPVFQGKALADLVSDGSALPIATIQLGAYRPDLARQVPAPVPVARRPAALRPDDIRQRSAPRFRREREAVDLTRAERIVAAGRGIREEGRLAVVKDLAAALGAELAASRPICDAGWLPMDRQVGSSGQTVAPRLYVAVGISGAIQHVVGMKGARTIVAINIDPDAPIFEVAHYGIVGDLFDVVPAIVTALNEERTRRA